MEITKTIKLGTMGFKPDDIKKIKASGIDTDEIIKLAENGYSVTDVNELITLAQEPDVLQPGDSADKKEPEPQGNEGEKDSINYKEELAKSTKEIEDLKATVKKLQDDNTHKEREKENTKSAEQQFMEALANLDY